MENRVNGESGVPEVLVVGGVLDLAREHRVQVPPICLTPTRAQIKVIILFHVFVFESFFLVLFFSF